MYSRHGHGINGCGVSTSSGFFLFQIIKSIRFLEKNLACNVKYKSRPKVFHVGNSTVSLISKVKVIRPY